MGINAMDALQMKSHHFLIYRNFLCLFALFMAFLVRVCLGKCYLCSVKVRIIGNKMSKGHRLVFLKGKKIMVTLMIVAVVVAAVVSQAVNIYHKLNAGC